MDGASVLYGSASELRATLEYDFSQEKDFSYKDLSMDEVIHHLAFFISRLWQIHIFGEGNTRTTAVFFIKYLRTLGFKVTNDIFAKSAWYFRNALVRANYNDLKRGIHMTTEFLELFLRNLLLDEQNELHNREMHVSGKFINDKKVNIASSKVNIGEEKVNIGIEPLNEDKFDGLSTKTIEYIRQMYNLFGKNKIFGRADAQSATGLGNTRMSALLKELSESKIIEPVKGHGKGKYRFC
ncbi:MAG: Fic family protein [Lachnospiraceae bacterium]|nr:Fic family protein [Lachnospiraceae bacterium]